MDPYFVYYGYEEQGGLLKNIDGVTNTTFWYVPNTLAAEVWSKSPVYGYDLTNSNFTAVLEGYFYAEQSGNYTFNVTADDQLSLQLGRGQSCCGNFATDIATSKIVSTTYGIPYEERWQIITLRANSYTVQLESGNYYPIRLVYFNTVGSNILLFKVTGPDGTTTDDFKDVWQVDPAVSCPDITTIPWTGSYVTEITGTATGTDGRNTIEVLTPDRTTITTTVPWTGTYTSTFSTDSGVTSVSGGSELIVTDWVETPTTTYTTPPPTSSSVWCSTSSSEVPPPSNHGNSSKTINQPQSTKHSSITASFISSHNASSAWKQSSTSSYNYSTPSSYNSPSSFTSSVGSTGFSKSTRTEHKSVFSSSIYSSSRKPTSPSSSGVSTSVGSSKSASNSSAFTPTASVPSTKSITSTTITGNTPSSNEYTPTNSTSTTTTGSESNASNIVSKSASSIPGPQVSKYQTESTITITSVATSAVVITESGSTISAFTTETETFVTIVPCSTTASETEGPSGSPSGTSPGSLTGTPLSPSSSGLSISASEISTVPSGTSSVTHEGTSSSGIFNSVYTPETRRPSVYSASGSENPSQTQGSARSVSASASVSASIASTPGVSILSPTASESESSTSSTPSSEGTATARANSVSTSGSVSSSLAPAALNSSSPTVLLANRSTQNTFRFLSALASIVILII